MGSYRPHQWFLPYPHYARIYSKGILFLAHQTETEPTTSAYQISGQHFKLHPSATATMMTVVSIDQWCEDHTRPVA